MVLVTVSDPTSKVLTAVSVAVSPGTMVTAPAGSPAASRRAAEVAPARFVSRSTQTAPAGSGS